MTRATGTDSRTGRLGVVGLAAMAAAGIALGIASGWAVLALTRPSDDDLQRAALEEIGLPADLESAPFVGRVLDTYTDRIQRRVLAESRPSATLALAVGVITGTTGTVAVCAAAGRIWPPHQHPHNDTELAHGPRR